MESKDSNPRQGSDPYEYIISWVKQINKKNNDEQTRQSWEDDKDDGRKLSAGNGSEVDVTSDSGDSVENVVDIYLDIQQEGEQANASNPYGQLHEWAKRFDQGQKESVAGQPERREEKQESGAPNSTEKRARPDVDDPIDNNDDNSDVNIT
ncbi:hypothetical protein QBC32DRAFT_377898 [Pseudoneurospora amorphoporcata]|uniref:Uncharacterized protein n=1 Tax=Pseudoneurospora amorphoporcata TaxID=241081 RepID=A0AAN6NRQ2_9PEZI|nr:hypothetical protein QBC32DRAFT_377898 [Pseudoneurospora amorphoporcata]